MTEPNFDIPPVADIDTADWLRVESGGKLPYDNVRFSVMQGSDRLWACDGEYVACRPKGFHSATRERHERFLASGHYEHVGTFDDVQVFKLLPGSPFKRETKTFIPGRSLWSDIRGAAIAATARDWVLFHDILESIATGLKAAHAAAAAEGGDRNGHGVDAATMYQDALDQVFINIAHRRGPDRAEVDKGLASVRRARGLGSKVLVVPPTRQVIR